MEVEPTSKWLEISLQIFSFFLAEAIAYSTFYFGSFCDFKVYFFENEKYDES